jgi:hypothetical protein
MNPDLKKVNEMLGTFLEKAKQKNANQDRSSVVSEVSKNIMDVFAPALQELASNSKINKDELAAVLREIQIAAPEVKIPEIQIPEIKVPTPQVTVNVPRAEKPQITVQPTPVTFPSEMSLKPNAKPFPVIMMDQAGKPMQFPQSASGGRGDFFTIKDIQSSAGISIIDQDTGAMKVSGSFSVSASNSSTQAIDSSATPYSQANPFPVTVVSGGSATTGSAIVDSSGVQYSGSNPLPITGTVLASDVTASLKSALVDSTGVQYSGSNPVPITWVSGAGVSTQVNISDSTGVGYSGSNPFPITGTVVVSSITATTASALVDSGGGQYSTSNPLPINTVAGGPDSMFVYVAHTANPTAVSDGADVRPMSDKMGRQVTRPMHVRDLIATARVNVVNGTETTLLAASAGVFLDCISVTAANNSTGAIKADFRSVTGGNVEFTLNVPASATAGVVHAVPWPAGNTGNNWTVDLSDDTHDVTFNALFTKEI